jgi:hypothetical protein
MTMKRPVYTRVSRQSFIHDGSCYVLIAHTNIKQIYLLRPTPSRLRFWLPLSTGRVRNELVGSPTSRVLHILMYGLRVARSVSTQSNWISCQYVWEGKPAGTLLV